MKMVLLPLENSRYLMRPSSKKGWKRKVGKSCNCSNTKSR